MLKLATLIFLIAWLPSGCAAAPEQRAAVQRAAQAAFCWPLHNFRYSRSNGGGWLAPRGRGSFHLGVDMFAPIGTPVLAVADGIVHDISTGGWGRGNVAIMVKHRLADGRWFIALYGHIRNSNGLRKGSRVHACGSIGSVGSYSCGSHLHFGVIAPGRLPHAPYGTSKRADHNNFIDPLQFLRDGQPGSTVEAAAQAPVLYAEADRPAAKKSISRAAEKIDSSMVAEESLVSSDEIDILAAKKSASRSTERKKQGRSQVRKIRSKNKKQAVAAGKKSRGKKLLSKKSAKKAVAQKSKRSSSKPGKVRSLTGSSKRSVSARKRR